FCKGLIESVRWLGWPPDIIHCHEWMTSLIPLYLKRAYKDDPIFRNAKLLYSVYDSPYDSLIEEKFLDKASINNLEEDDLQTYLNGEGLNLNHGALLYADASILGDLEAEEDDSLAQLLKNQEHPVFVPEADEIENVMKEYMKFYHTLLEEETPAEEEV